MTIQTYIYFVRGSYNIAAIRRSQNKDNKSTTQAADRFTFLAKRCKDLSSAYRFLEIAQVYKDTGDDTLKVDEAGIVQLPEFPGNKKLSDVDWALKMKKVEP